MQCKKLTITVDEKVYEGLDGVIVRRNISQFIESMVPPLVLGKKIKASLVLEDC